MNLTRLLPLLLLLASCSLFADGYEHTFEEGNWDVGDIVGVSSEIANGELVVEVELPKTTVWSVAGRNDLTNGVYEVTGEVVSGSAETALGLIFRADPAATNFHYVLVSADGAYSLGQCTNLCDSETEFLPINDQLWIESDAFTTGVGVPHHIRAELQDETFTVAIDDLEIGTFTSNLLEKGDIGIFVQTFSSGATVTFDDLRYIPADN